MDNNEAIYTYEYPYGKEQFTENLKAKFGNSTMLDGSYLIKYKGNDNFFLGVERAGHCGGNWYVANVIEVDGKTKITGNIVYNPDENGQETKIERKLSIKENLGLMIMSILFLPLVIPFAVFFCILSLINKIRKKCNKQPLLNYVSKEEKLDKFMIEYLNCKKL